METTIKITSAGQARLIETMASRLRTKAPDKPRKWGSLGAEELQRHLHAQVDNLVEADSDDAWKKTADVANFAAMIADNKAKGLIR